MQIGAPKPINSSLRPATLLPNLTPVDVFRPSSVTQIAALRPAGRGADKKLARLARQAMEQRGLRTDFTSAEMAQVSGRPATDNDPAIKNLQNLPWMAIDNRSTVNAEQVAVAEKLDGGRIKVRVAVSDVDAAVPEGSPLDRRAHQNARAIYCPGENFPMLPWELLDDQTSFQKDQERLAVVTEFVVGSDGAVEDIDCYRARVKNHGQLSYNQVTGWLNGEFPHSRTGEQLELQSQASERLTKNRQRHELVNLPDGDHPAREMVEELMKTANEVAVQYLEQKGFPTLYQSISEPDRWDRIVELAGRRHHSLPDQPDPKALKSFLKGQKQKLDLEEYSDLSISVSKLLGRHLYAAKASGKPYPIDFRLNAEESTRSTSPSRDYAALTVQRMLKSAIAGEPPPAVEQLESLAQHCNQKGSDAYKAKRQVYKCKDAMRLSSQIGHKFKATVSGAGKGETWVQLAGKYPVEGKVVKGSDGLDVGDRVQVRLKAVDPERGHIDFEVLN